MTNNNNMHGESQKRAPLILPELQALKKTDFPQYMRGILALAHESLIRSDDVLQQVIEAGEATLRKFDRKIDSVSIFTGKPFTLRNGLDRLGEGFLGGTIDLGSDDPARGNPPPFIIEQSHRIKRIICDIYSRQKDLLHVSSGEFEEVVAELLRHQGFEVQLTKRTRDGGFDLIALQQLQSQFPLKFLVECKRFSERKVGVDVIRKLMCVVQEQGATKGMIATTSYFTQVAREAQQQMYPYRLDLQDQMDILSWVRRYMEE